MQNYRKQLQSELIGKNRWGSKVVSDLRITPLASLTN